VDFIHAHYAQPLSLREIAAAAHLSPYHCLRVFKAAHGSTPTEYLKNCRLCAAERLLRDTKMRVDEVAARVGFENRTTLFRHMRRVRGVAPSAVRRTPAEAHAAAAKC
jgi:AraC family transcriptional regulator